MMNMAEVHGTQKSSDPLWNNSKIAYRGVTDMLSGKGTQHGYYDNNHAGAGRDPGNLAGSGNLATPGEIKIMRRIERGRGRC